MDDPSRLRRKEMTKGPPLRILSLDGGGVRGYSMLVILQELMHRTFVEIEGRAPKRHEIPKPCDHFDLIAGTGTGGLIAIMLGRLRLDLDTCKDLYVRLTRRVFETDKTIAGIPFKSTMFKASKLEEVIREVVREHTVFGDEGNDALAAAVPMTPETPGADSGATPRTSTTIPSRSLSQHSRYSQVGMSPIHPRMNVGSLRFGDPNALLYDSREHRTKTALTAVMKGTQQTQLLRSYDSRREPAPDVNCTIWQAGRATAASAMAFKPIQIGQSVYLDEGTGKYNPAPKILDEAKNEFPGQEVGVFISVGTGKRPGTSLNQHEWWEGLLGGTMGDFAEARRRLIAKLEGCEDTHQFMLREHLSARGVNVENYYRLNVEIGVGEFGLNEWARISKISTNTRTYLAREDVELLSQSAAAKLAKIHSAKVRLERPQFNSTQREDWQDPWAHGGAHSVLAVELPAGDPPFEPDHYRPSQDRIDMHRPSVADAKYVVVAEDGYDQPPPQTPPKIPVHPVVAAQRIPSDTANRNEPQRYPSYPLRASQDPFHPPQTYAQPGGPPPLPPKTPLPYPDPQTPVSPTSPYNTEQGPKRFMNMGDLGRRLPYPDHKYEDAQGPPPEVNMRSKPSLAR